ncbi:MAG: dinitrogenase iron-molybdenum cofactor [Desulfobacterales bacterium]|nr:dinitrogenase iron-molybdenum cofactor [Desulfobacterales bacterium]
MRIAFPVAENIGIKSLVNEHFGVAKQFMVVDLETRTVTTIPNKKADGNSGCKTGFIGKKAGVDAVVTKCIGDGSQRGLHADNIKVYAAGADTVAENLTLFEKGELKLFHIFDLCQGKKNKKEGGCGHHH